MNSVRKGRRVKQNGSNNRDKTELGVRAGGEVVKIREPLLMPKL